MSGCCCVCVEALKKVKNFDRRKQETGSPSCSQCRRQQQRGRSRGRGRKRSCGAVAAAKIFLCVEIFQLDQITHIYHKYMCIYREQDRERDGGRGRGHRVVRMCAKIRATTSIIIISSSSSDSSLGASSSSPSSSSSFSTSSATSCCGNR